MKKTYKIVRVTSMALSLFLYFGHTPYAHGCGRALVAGGGAMLELPGPSLQKDVRVVRDTDVVLRYWENAPPNLNMYDKQLKIIARALADTNLRNKVSYVRFSNCSGPNVDLALDGTLWLNSPMETEKSTLVSKKDIVDAINASNPVMENVTAARNRRRAVREH